MVAVTANRLFAIGVTLLAAAGVIGAVRYSRHTGVVPAGPSGGGEKVELRFLRHPAPMPAFSLKDLDGTPIDSSRLAGKVVLLNFWATWCPPCRAEIPDLIALQEKYRDQIQIIGVSEDDAPPDTVRQFVAEHKMNYTVAMTTPEMERAFPGIDALPTSFLIDREGRVARKHVGMLNPTVTELEARALAGLSVDATITQVDDDAATRHVVNAAQATEIPGIDLSALSPAKKAAALQKLNSDKCTCGCGNTVAQCRLDDPDCGVSLPLARAIVADIAGKP